MLRRRRGLWAALASACVVLLGLAQLESQLERALSRSIPDIAVDALVLLSGTGLLVSAALWLLSFLPEKDEPLYLPGEAQPSAIPALRLFAVEFFGPTFATEQRIRGWLAQRKDCVIVIRRIARKGRARTQEILGFYMLLPLTRHAVELYLRNEITGATFLNEHIAKTGPDTFGLYVAAIAATEQQAKNSTLLLLYRSLEEYRQQGVRVVLARPTTQRGRELADEFEMHPVPGTEIDGQPLYRRDLTQPSPG